jgi:hypothetical protein
MRVDSNNDVMQNLSTELMGLSRTYPSKFESDSRSENGEAISSAAENTEGYDAECESVNCKSQEDDSENKTQSSRSREIPEHYGVVPISRIRNSGEAGVFIRPSGNRGSENAAYPILSLRGSSVPIAETAIFAPQPSSRAMNGSPSTTL